MINWKRIFLNEKKKTTGIFIIELSKKDKREIWRKIKKELKKRERTKRYNGWK